MTQRDTLVKIAKRLINISIVHMTMAEKQIIKDLIAGGIVEQKAHNKYVLKGPG